MRGQGIRRWIGLAALLVFVLMLVLLGQAMPDGVAFGPQTWPQTYSEAELFAFWRDLGETGKPELYRNTLVYLDTIFIALLCLWSVLHLRDFGPSLRVAGLVVVAIFAVADLGENLNILASYEFLGGAGWVVYVPVGPARAGYFTIAKTLALVALAVLLLAGWARKTKGASG